MKTTHIPKRLFYVWFGDDMPMDVHACILTWKFAMPDYEIIRIDQNKSEWFDFDKALEECEWLRAVYERKMWAYVSDYIRIKVLHDHGGIYLDTDVTTLKNFDALRSDCLFVGYQSPIEVNGAIIGSVKQHEYLKLLLNHYEENHIFSSTRYLLPEVMTHVLKEHYGFKPVDSRLNPEKTILHNISIYPEHAFYPFRYMEKYADECINMNTYCIHWWKASWHSGDNLQWLQVGRLEHLSEENTVNEFPPTSSFKKSKLRKLKEFFYKVKMKNNATKYYLLSLPVLVIREPKIKKYLYIFNTFPICRKK